ncbi:hypothetical protein D3870_08695 [Noviherbaspirillum cavernae]|uniref:Phospholipase A1 n=1 Tax=Noviherbaspirillum cavernae TaxID=2320862 RepID=A0A418X0Q0_9BURK|nr:phospholipase A [Noviherbaspirillum cavernae]RJG06077.1 hypothetical protein D3870_08695 [Noviherbaspirillum cavernae]
MTYHHPPYPRLIILSLLFSGSAFAADQSAAFADCARVAENKLRLECYDRLAERASDAPADAANAAAPAAETAIAEEKRLQEEPFSLVKHWELDDAHKRGTFAFRPHTPNYVLLANTSRDPNVAPFEPLIALDPDNPKVSNTELSFQLGFKVKALENVINKSDLWFGYTQRSFWQAYNSDASSPFRETNYQPEVMFVTPLNFDLLGLHTRFVNVGLVHQSNGQSGSLSRSWNRVYVQAGFERGDFNVLARVWHRFHENQSEDDNPDIVDYMGRGDLIANYRWRGHDFSVLARRNFDTGKGAVQLGWGFPLSEQLKGYIQFFSGYGQSLIDYNSYQQSIGLGFLIDF